MKIEDFYKITADSYIEQQILEKQFPGSWFDVRGGLRNPKIIFYIPKDDKSDKFIKEWKEKENGNE